MIRHFPLRLLLSVAMPLILLHPHEAQGQAAAAPAATAAAPAYEPVLATTPRISIATIGKGSPVILIPGLSSPRATWDGVVAALAVSAGIALAVASRAPAGATDQVTEGRQLYLAGCVSCHGIGGRGVTRHGSGAHGPSLRDAGEAGAYYMLSTGRMPLNDPDQAPHRKDPAYSPRQIDALVAYVASLGHGPALPHVSTSGADLATGHPTDVSAP